MILRSLRWRLLAGGGVAVLVALAVAWVVMTLLFERHLDARTRIDLTRDAIRLAAALTIDAAGRPSVGEPLTDPRFDVAASGLYWQVGSGDNAVRSRSLWDQGLDTGSAVSADSWSLRRAPGPFEAEVFVLQRAIRPDANGPAVVIMLAQDAHDVASAQDEFGRELASFLALLWLVLMSAAWLQVHLGLQPLRRVRDDLEAMRGDSSARLQSGWATEVMPLTDAINALAQAREDDVRRARTRAADLAHGLKTPLAALSAQSRRIREEGHEVIADGLDVVIERLQATTQAELARSRMAGPRHDTHCLAHDVVECLIEVLERTERGERIAFSNLLDPAATAPMAEEDFAELIGPLIENATRFARRRVSISAFEDAGRMGIAIDDDGPGVAMEREADILVRGARFDETAGGQGLGLSIAREYADMAGADLALTRSLLGGLRVMISWSRALTRPLPDPSI